MTPSTASAAPPDGIAEILAWLAAPVPSDPALDLPTLSLQLAALDGAGLDPARYDRILDLFHDRTHRLSRELMPRLIQAGLPLDRILRAQAVALIDVNSRIAAGYERVLREAGDSLPHSRWRSPSVIAARALLKLHELTEIGFMIASPPPIEIWRRAHALALMAREHLDPESTATPGIPLDADRIYKAMLALAAAQPEGFAPGEIALACEYLGQFSAAVDILPASPPEGEGGWYWLDTARDAGPVPPNRRVPPHHGDLLFCSFQRLARLLGEQISALEEGMPAGNLRLPERASGHAGLSALKRLHEHWSAPPHRKFTRRHNNYRAEICIGLNELWQLLEHGEGPPGTHAAPAQTTEWMILNESPGGFAVMHVSGEVEGLVPGSALALRAAADKPWSICVVRWLKSENPEHIELGLELVSPAARTVHILFRNGDSEQQPTSGLLLPAIPALREHPALLAPSGAYSARRFFIVSGEEKTHVMQGRLLSLDMQTGAIELFQFEPDPYPI